MSGLNWPYQFMFWCWLCVFQSISLSFLTLVRLCLIVTIVNTVSYLHIVVLFLLSSLENIEDGTETIFLQVSLFYITVVSTVVTLCLVSQSCLTSLPIAICWSAEKSRGVEELEQGSYRYEGLDVTELSKGHSNK